MCIPIQPTTCHPLTLAGHFVEVQHTDAWFAVKVNGVTVAEIKPDGANLVASLWDAPGKPKHTMTVGGGQ